MKMINAELYNSWKANQSGPYGLAVFEFAERWADAMEEKIANAEKLENVAKQLSIEVADGITGFQYGVAVSVLAHCWKYGEQLRRWHNLETQIGDEGEKANESGGILNPALLMT